MRRSKTFIGVLTGAVLALGVFSGPAPAASSAGELVSGTTSGLMALTGSAATFGAGFTPGARRPRARPWPPPR
jgi:hypothetical protein